MTTSVNPLNPLNLTFNTAGSKKTRIDWARRQKEQNEKWEAEKKARTEYFEDIKEDYESICKQIGWCIFQYVGCRSFKPNLLLGEYEFIQMDNMSKVMKNYTDYLKIVREHEYYKKSKKKSNNFPKGYIPEYAPWSFKDRWERVIHRLETLGYLEKKEMRLHGVLMCFYEFNKDKLNELEKEAFVNFI